MKINFLSSKQQGISIMSIAILLISIAIYVFAPNQHHELNQILGDEYVNYQVSRIVDGDTIKVYIDGEEETVRLIGVDTPETVHPNKEVECFGQEASDYTKQLLENSIVRLEFDQSQGEADRYGRLLAYVFREDDSLFVNKELIANGYTYEYTYNTPYKYQNDFQEAQENAQSLNLGLWSNICQ